jgi:hypothetical protein
MERCGEGINWKINDEILSSSSAEKGAKMFRKKVRDALKEKTPEGPAEGPGDRKI